MSTENKEIKSFFDDMRKEDLKNTIPEFEALFLRKKKSKIRYMIPVGIAASLILGFGIWNKKSETIPEQDTLVISLENQEITTDVLLSNDVSIFTWESSTASLINDFND